MKFGGARFPKGNVLLFISFTFISICFLLMISAINTQYKNRLSNNDMYSGHQKNFTIMYSDDENQWDEVVPALSGTNDDFAIYVTVPDREKSIRGIYINGKIENPPMIHGKYFDNETSWTDKPAVVLGKEYQADLTEKNGTTYYMLNGVEYEVLGVIGTKYDSRLNHMIFIDFKSAVSLTGINTSYTLDAKKKNDIQEVGQNMVSLFKYPANVLILLEEGMQIPLINRLLSSDMIMNTLYVMILISFSLSTVLVTFIWLRFRERLFFAFYLCGYTVKSECMEISKRFYFISGTGFLTGLIMTSVLTIFMKDFELTIRDVITAFATTIILGSIILFFSYIFYKKKRRKT